MATEPEPEPAAAARPSVLHGPAEPPLVDLSLGEVLALQAQRHGGRECLVTPWTGARWSYAELERQSAALARGLAARAGVRAGDRVAIMAGNCARYAAVFFAAARAGAVLVVLNSTYAPAEALRGLAFAGCRALFTTRAVGGRDNGPLLGALAAAPAPRVDVFILRGEGGGYATYDDLVRAGEGEEEGDGGGGPAERVLPHQVVNLQFTSGTTGQPKAAMLTHHNLVNNARFIGDRMRLTPDDVLCCPPPLFHCFGLVLGLLAVVTHGAKVVYPAEVFDAAATLRAISDEGCTAVHGVPAMFDSLFQAEPPPGFDCRRLRTGIIAGAPVPRRLMELLVERFGMTEFTSSYGLTEASPTCFNAFTDDAIDTRLTTVGSLMPHAHAKIVDGDGNVVPVGTRGELCIAGYQLQAGYWNNADKTDEVMVRDDAGVRWLRTGDEAVFDDRGYCTITGRLKDIIIRGGENIYPLEIEERLVAHPSIGRAIVVGLKDRHYGEVVGAFVERSGGAPPTAEAGEMEEKEEKEEREQKEAKPGDDEVRDWVRARLGRHKSPAHIFWLGEGGVPAEVPLTGSGKVRKHEMASLGNEIVRRRRGEGAVARL